MIWLFCFVLALCLFLEAIVFSAILFFKKVRVRVNPVNVLFGGWAASSVFLNLPVYVDKYRGDSFDTIKSLILAFHHAIRAFSVDDDYSIIGDGVANMPEWLEWLCEPYTALAYLLLLLAPILTFGFLLSFFKNITSYLKYKCFPFRDTYIFSELNEKTLSLAEDIEKNHKKVLIVFTDVFEKEEEDTYELIQRARALGAVCFKGDILTVNLRRKIKNTAMYLFVMGSDEAENISQALKLRNIYKDRENTRLYVFTTRIESELLLNGNKESALKVRRINEVRSLITHLLYNDGQKIFSSAKEAEDNMKHIGAVVVGMGRYGTEMVKSLSWYCQMDGYKIKIDAFDKDPLAKEKFSALCPELMSKRYNGVSIPDEAEYTININSGISVDTKQFADEIMKLKDTTYVMVTLGNDKDNIKTAVNLRMLFERIGAKPVIQTVVYSRDAREALEGIVNYRGQAYDIDFICDVRTENVIIDSEVEAEALARHLKWGKEEEFWGYEYNYSSSVASAVHMKARVECNIPGAYKKEEELTDSERDIIEKLEHRRWNAYMRSEGYIYSGSHNKESRNDLAKMHHDLVEFSGLDEDEKRKDSKVGAR